VDGKKEGTMVELNESGQLLRQSNFHNDLQEGEYKEFNYGTVKEERFYKLGKLEGTVKIFLCRWKAYGRGALYEWSTRWDFKMV
jgi:antitoxin component YwqK of YwqJK toxin-antitoxin module